jgi:hypothetical protein
LPSIAPPCGVLPIRLSLRSSASCI